MATVLGPVVDMLDALGIDARAIPAGTRRVAIYLTGTNGIAWTSADVAELKAQDPQIQTILRIDQSNRIVFVLAYVIKDIEPGASTVDVAIADAKQRAIAGLHTGFYFSRADWPIVTGAIAGAKLEPFIDLCPADWNLNRDQAIEFLFSDPRIKAVQWASPTSNPRTLVPGTVRTLAQANVDLWVTRQDWPAPLPAPRPAPKPPKPSLKPHPKVTAAAAGGAIAAVIQGLAHVKLTPTEIGLITTAVATIAGYLKASGA